jgi:SAM-dependent methyltransferase
MPAIGTQGSSAVQGELWGARAQDYAQFQEPVCKPLYQRAIGLTDIGVGTTVLDVGCGAGGFCRLALDAGATVSGLDAAPGLAKIARERAPDAHFDVGDMEDLPYRDRSFDVVTGFNSFQYAADPASAIAEAGRVTRRGGKVFVLVWGREEQTELVAVLQALRPLLPPAPGGTPGPFALSEPGALEALVERSGLTPTRDGYIEFPFEYPDEQALLRGNRSNGPVVLAERTSGEAAVIDALRGAFDRYRTASGAYRIETEWRYVVATV